MTARPVPLLLALSACAGVPMASTSPPSPACHELRPAPRCGPPPADPAVDWVSPGCPPRFGACLTGADSAALAAYLQAARRWMGRCADGR